MSQCSAAVWKMARRIIAEGNTRRAGVARAQRDADARQDAADAASLCGTASVTAPTITGKPLPPPATLNNFSIAPVYRRSATNNRSSTGGSGLGGGQVFLPGGMVLGTQPIAAHTAAEVSVPHDLPGQDVEGGSEMEFDGSRESETGEIVGSPPVSHPVLDGPLELVGGTPLNVRMAGSGPEAPATPVADPGTPDAVPLTPPGGFPSPFMDGVKEASAPAGAVGGVAAERAATTADPTLMRKSLMEQRTHTAAAAFIKAHEHPGFHPYRIVLGHVSTGGMGRVGGWVGGGPARWAKVEDRGIAGRPEAFDLVLGEASILYLLRAAGGAPLWPLC